MRNAEAEAEMRSICAEVWSCFNLMGILKTKMIPKTFSKQGGSSGCYYPDKHTVYFRWNVWNKMPLAGKRMLAIHELYHATGNKHNGKYMFCHAYDILTIELYKRIYGEDVPYQEAVASIKELF
jgi:hypothetical protein